MNALPRAADLGVEQKASLTLGADFWHTRDLPEAGVASLLLSDGPHGLRVQRANAADHVGLGRSEPATCFPTAAGLGSTWDPDLVREVAAAIGREARALGVSVVLGPGVNIKRSPLCGRNFEYFSEDPLLSGALGAAWVDGLQSEGAGASVKHYAVNNQETDRLRVSADVSERAMREIYLPAFEQVVTRSRPWTVMCAYNRVNGVHASQHHWLLTEVLRDEWGFDGLVVSDWGAVHDRVAALEAGLDLEMPPNTGRSDVAVVQAAMDGRLAGDLLDAAADRVLELVARATAAGPPSGPADLEAHHALARRVAHSCAVLLKNEGDLLPLAPVPGDRVAVLGELARSPRFQGSGSSQVNPTRVDAALDALRDGLPAGVRLDFAPGYDLTDEADPEPLLAEAVAVASGAAVAVVFLGLPGLAESEGFDRTHLDLPRAQIELLDRVRQVCGHVVVVLTNGSVVTVGWQDRADAVLECWLPGQAGGGAVADLLLGLAEPGGRLAETMPLRLEDTPCYLTFPGGDGHVVYGEDVFVGYRGYDARGTAVAYPFGHGLGYTRFTTSDPAVTVTGSAAGGDLAVAVTCTVTNVGARAGKEVVQVYLRDPEAAVPRPPRELKGFAAVRLEPGQAQQVRVVLDARAFSYWSQTDRCWVLEPGEFVIEVARSSRDVQHELVVTLDGAVPPRPISRTSTLAEWLADPKAAEVLRAALTGPDGGLTGALADPHYAHIVGSFPMSALVTFGKTGLSNATLDAMLDALGAADPV